MADEGVEGTGRGPSHSAPGSAPADDLVVRAEAFARDLHAGFAREGQKGRAFVTHLEEVVELLLEARADDEVLAAGWLHEAVENRLTARRRVTARELADRFGWQVAAMVAELTPNARIPEPLRRDIRIRSVRFATRGAAMITLADLTSQLRGLIADAPERWTHGQKVEHFGWAGRVAANCCGVSATLETGFQAAYREGLARLAAEA